MNMKIRKNAKKNVHRGWRRIQFDAPPDVVAVIDGVKDTQHITASAFVRAGFTAYLVDRGLLARPAVGVGIDFCHHTNTNKKEAK